MAGMNDFENIRSAKAGAYSERRKKEDWMVKAAAILSVIAWGVAIAVWYVLEAAAPEREMRFITSLMETRFDTPTAVRQYWDAALLQSAFGLLAAALIICVIAFIFNKMRMKRKTDKYRKSIFILGGISIIGIIAFLIRFGLPF